MINDLSNRRLNSIDLVQQPPDSLLCGAANAKMVMNYFFSDSDDIYNIYQQVTAISTMGRRYNANYLIAQYLEKNKLNVSMIRFSDLEAILNYCEKNQTPAIMNIQVETDPLLGHLILFTGYKVDEDIVRILDPENISRTSIQFKTLSDSFIKISDNAEIGGNIMILASDKLKSKQKFICKNCKKENSVETEILNAIQGLICINCDRFVSVH